MAAHFLLHLSHQDMEVTQPSEPYYPDARSVRTIKHAHRELTPFLSHPRQHSLQEALFSLICRLVSGSTHLTRNT